MAKDAPGMRGIRSRSRTVRFCFDAEVVYGVGLIALGATQMSFLN